MLIKRLQLVLGTAYVLGDMSTLLDAAKKAQSAKIISKIDASRFKYLEKYTKDAVATVLPEDAKEGLFFSLKQLGSTWLLFPELHLSSESMRASLLNPVGAVVAQGATDANIVIDSAGFLHITSSLHATIFLLKPREGRFLRRHHMMHLRLLEMILSALDLLAFLD